MGKEIKINPIYFSLINFILFIILLFSFNVPISFSNEVNGVVSDVETHVVKNEIEDEQELLKTPNLEDENEETLDNVTQSDFFKQQEEVQSTIESKENSKISESYDSSADNNVINTTRGISEIVNFNIRKTWEDNNDEKGLRPKTVRVIMNINGEPRISFKLNEKDNWAYDLFQPRYNLLGEEKVFSITEVPVYFYETTIEGFNIRNKLTQNLITIKGNKTWDDNNNQDGKRPNSVVINLLANGRIFDRKRVYADGSYSFENLPKYYNGTEIIYTIEEEIEPHYEMIIDGFNIVNKRTTDLINIEGRKIWDDNNNQDGLRPKKVVIALLANPGLNESKWYQTISEATNWSYSFKNLPKYKNGKEIIYKIYEPWWVKGYTPTIDGYNIINKRNNKPVNPSEETPLDPPIPEFNPPIPPVDPPKPPVPPVPPLDPPVPPVPPVDSPVTPISHLPSTPLVTLQEELGSTTIDTTDSLSIVQQSTSNEPKVVSYEVILPETGEADVTFISIMLLIMGSGLYILYIKKDGKYN